MKKCVSLFFTLLIACTLCVAPAAAAGFTPPENIEITATAVYIVNLDTDITVYEREAHTRRSIASLTKLMTALLLIENVPDLDGTVILADPRIYVPPITNSDSSHADIRPYEEVTAKSLLYAMLLPSGNEAAAIAAYHLGNGNLANFYAMMNARAAELGCVDTNFTNPHGLGGMDEGNYSTAYDLTLIARACWQHEVFKTVVTATEYEMPATNKHAQPYKIYTTNRMQMSSSGVYRSYIRGMKTGSTMDAGRNFISTATSPNGETYMAAILGCPWEPAADGYAYSFHDAMHLYDWVFAGFSVRPALDTTTAISEIKVQYSTETDTIKLFPAEDLRTILPNDAGASALEKTFDVPDSIEAPVRQGDVVGTITVSLAGEVIGTSNLLAGQDVARNPLLYFFALVGKFFKSLYFRVVLILTLIFLVAYGALMMYFNKQAAKRKAARAALRKKPTPPPPPTPDADAYRAAWEARRKREGRDDTHAHGKDPRS